VTSRKLKALLYSFSVVGSGAGFVTQMLVSGFWSTAFSNDIFYFSVNVAFYFLALGVGSLLSRKVRVPTATTLFWIGIALCFWTGISISLLRFVMSQVPASSSFPLTIVPIFTVSVAGILSGMIIPLCLRVPSGGVDLPVIFFLDYTAAIIFTLLFTFVLLIPQGYSRTSLILSVSCLIILALLATWAGLLTTKRVVVMAAAIVIPGVWGLGQKVNTAPRMDDSGEAEVLYSEQSHYQKIVLTEEPNDDPYLGGSRQHVLYLDGFVQFSSYDEQTYHFCLANIPVVAAEYANAPAKKVLILGGGDGLAARNLLGVSYIDKIRMVELDPAMIHLARHNKTVLSYNQNALSSPKVEVLMTDAFRWVTHHEEQYDIILIDFPAPKNLTLSRLFSAEFYSRVLKLLKPKGFMAIQAGPSFSYDDPTFMTLSKVTTSIKKTFASLGYSSYAYVTPRDKEAFILVTPDPKFNMQAFAQTVGIYGQTGMGQLCTYHTSWKEPEAEPNTLNTLRLATYMMDWFQKAGKPFFYYHGNHSIFLPE
jgi:spermidine synthase